MKRLRMPKSISISSSSSSRSKPDGDKPSKTFDFDNDEYTDDGADALFGEEESDEDMLSKALMGDSVCICQRCFRLQQYGQVEENLRPGWSDHELLTPERFEDLLTGRYQERLSMSLISTLTHITNSYRNLRHITDLCLPSVPFMFSSLGIKETSAVVLCIVDVFDLKGSLLANLRQIAGKNPIVIAANKVDLLPKDVSSVRLTNWIHAEVKELCGLRRYYNISFHTLLQHILLLLRKQTYSLRALLTHRLRSLQSTRFRRRQTTRNVRSWVFPTCEERRGGGRRCIASYQCPFGQLSFGYGHR